MKRGIEFLELEAKLNGGCSEGLVVELVIGRFVPRDIQRARTLCPKYVSAMHVEGPYAALAFFPFWRYINYQVNVKGGEKEILPLFRNTLLGDDRAARELGNRLDKAKPYKSMSETSSETKASSTVRAVLDGVRDGLNQSLSTMPAGRK